MTAHKIIVVTACKNEERNLPKLIESMESQTIKPVLWLIVDDGSTDRTSEIIEEAKKKHKWIQSIRLNGSKKRDLGLHYASILKKGFDNAIERCKINGINYEYLVNIDADMVLESAFFEKLIARFEKDPKLGVASGGIYHYKGKKIVRVNVRESEPSGADMVIRRECFEDCGGFPVSYACDSVFNTKAKLRGWRTKRFENVIAIETRDTSSAEGYWRGYVLRGRAAYYLNFNFFHVIFKSIMYLIRKPHYIGIAYLYGYLSDILRRNSKIRDRDIRFYYKYIRMKEIIQYYGAKLKIGKKRNDD